MAKGIKTGGRKRGTPNKAPARKAAEIAESGLTPLEYLLQVLRDERKATDERLEAARSAAPYAHPRLSAVQLTGKDGDAIEVKDTSASVDEFMRRIARIAAAQAGPGKSNGERHG